MTTVGMVERIAAGDELALHAVVERYLPKLTKLAYYRLFDWGDAEEIAMDALAKLLDHIASIRDDAHLGRWLYTVVRNRCTSVVRKRKVREGAVKIVPLESAAGTGVDSTMQVLSQIEAAELLALLSPKERSFADLLATGYNAQEVSLRLGVPAGTVRSRMNHVRGKINRFREAEGTRQSMQMAVVRLLRAKGHVTTAEIAHMAGVSFATAHDHLRYLEARGFLQSHTESVQRVSGGRMDRSVWTAAANAQRTA